MEQSFSSDRVKLLHERFGSGLEGVSGVGRLRYRYPDTAAKMWIFSSVFWFVVVTIFGLIIATELVAPEFFGGIGPLVFSRVRPCHVQGVLYAWLTMMYWGVHPLLLAAAARHDAHVEREARATGSPGS